MFIFRGWAGWPAQSGKLCGYLLQQLLLFQLSLVNGIQQLNLHVQQVHGLFDGPDEIAVNWFPNKTEIAPHVQVCLMPRLCMIVGYPAYNYGVISDKVETEAYSSAEAGLAAPSTMTSTAALPFAGTKPT